MINPSIDCEQNLGPTDWRRMNRWQLEMFARHGSNQQKDSLIAYGYSGLPAFMFEELYYIATGQPWLTEE